MRRGSVASAGALLLATLALGSAAAVADPLPPYDGAMTFPAIAGPSGPSEFSWEVQLGEGQALEQIDDRRARVYYTEDLATAFSILPKAAHDANGASVPTSLGVSGGNVITLFVPHQAGNPAAGGTPFEYPIVAGEGWEGGFKTEIVTGPKDEQELREERERRAREELEAEELVRASGRCLVPKLKGRSLRASKRRLKEAECTIGEVRKRKGVIARTGKVVKQGPKPGTVLAGGASINVTLGSSPAQARSYPGLRRSPDSGLS